MGSILKGLFKHPSDDWRMSTRRRPRPKVCCYLFCWPIEKIKSSCDLLCCLKCHVSPSPAKASHVDAPSENCRRKFDVVNCRVCAYAEQRDEWERTDSFALTELKENIVLQTGPCGYFKSNLDIWSITFCYKETTV